MTWGTVGKEKKDNKDSSMNDKKKQQLAASCSAKFRPFPVGPRDREKLLTSGHLGVRVKNVRRISGPKSACL